MPPKRKAATKHKAKPSSGERPTKRRTRNTTKADAGTEANPKREGAEHIYPLDQSFPHILEAIIAYSPAESLRVLRGVSKSVKGMVDDILPMHVTVEHDLTLQKGHKNSPKPLYMRGAWNRQLESVAVVPHHRDSSDRWISKRSSAREAENKRRKDDWEKRRLDALIKALEKKPKITKALAAEMADHLREDLERRTATYYGWFEEQVPIHLHPAERSPDAPRMEVEKPLEDIEISAKVEITADNVEITTDSDILFDSDLDDSDLDDWYYTGYNGFLPQDPNVAHAEKLLRDAGKCYRKWRYERPPTLDHVLPQGWGWISVASTRPYVVDLLALPNGFEKLNIRPRYLRYGPYIEPSWNCPAQDHVLVLPLCDQPLAAAFVPDQATKLIVSIRIDPGAVRPIVIIPNRSKHYVRNLTVIFSTTGTLRTGTNMAIMRGIFRDLAALLGAYMSRITFVDADCIPLAWFGVDTKHTVTSEWMFDLMDGVLKEEHVDRGLCSTEVFTLAKEDYMKTNGLSAMEYALRRGD